MPASVVRLQARVRELGAAGIDEGDRAALQELDQTEQRRVVLLVLRHRHLEPEDVGQRAAHVVQEDAADGVGVADVHVAVDEARGHQEVAGVDGAVGGHVPELARLAHAADALSLDEDRAVRDDPAVAVQGDHVAGMLDLQGRGVHGSRGSFRGSYGEDGIRAARAQVAGPRMRPGAPPRSSRAAGRVLYTGVARFRAPEDRWISGSLPSRRPSAPRCERGSRPTSRRTGPRAPWSARCRGPSSTISAGTGSGSSTRPGSSGSRGRRSTAAAGSRGWRSSSSTRSWCSIGRRRRSTSSASGWPARRSSRTAPTRRSSGTSRRS